ncbi:hypothetical protein BSL78_27216 [Apostichopus japonicus]|uniref:Uncharacterized protein n=1 Tax=Stichopus japonicus TaxID=307972 RepID=A0A2G8JJM5_STIJA|nr:hypothetical protein BSL78_27216 [Apostichopus japonicus]
MDTVLFFVMWMLIILASFRQTGAVNTNQDILRYSAYELKSLRPGRSNQHKIFDLPKEMRPRQRGHRSDRTPESLKERGGGVCAFINNKWCSPNNVHIKETLCTPDIELLALTIRPFYLPREFPAIHINVVYIPPSANVETAHAILIGLIAEQQTKSPDASHARNNMLDLFYCSVKDAYKPTFHPPLGNSDHDVITLYPTYRPVLRQSKPIKKTIEVWNQAVQERLQDCFEETDWDLFMNNCKDIDELTDTVGDI